MTFCPSTKYVTTNVVTFPEDTKLLNEYLSKISKGAYLHRYAGLWTLGCGCGMEVWFKKPTTKKSLIPKSIEIPKGFNYGKFYNDTLCINRKGGLRIHKLPDITNNNELIVNFTLWGGITGKKIVLGVYTNEDIISYKFEFQHNDTKTSYRQHTNIMSLGGTFLFSFRLTKYYIWMGFNSEIWDNTFRAYKYWTNNWWEGKLFKGQTNKNELKIDGDSITATPIIVKQMNKKDVQKLSKSFKHLILNLNNNKYKFIIPEIVNDQVEFRFNCKYNGNIKNNKGFEINLNVHDNIAFKLIVEIFEHYSTITAITGLIQEMENYTYNSILFSSEKETFFDLILFYNKNNESKTKIEFSFNGERLNKTLLTKIPVGMINQIEIKSNVKLQPPQLKHKKKLNKIIEGTILCFEAKIPKAKDIKGDKSFQQMNLVKNVNGNTVMVLNFTFDPLIYTFFGKYFNYTGGKKTFLTIKSFVNGNWTEEKKYRNPISQTDVPIIVHIIAGKKDVMLSIGKSTDYIHYSTVLPLWSVDYAMYLVVTKGYIHNVKIFTDTCKLIENKVNLPPNIFKINKKLTNSDVITIDGNVPIYFNKTTIITINLLYEALEWHKEVGQTVLQLNMTENCTSVNYYKDGTWGNKSEQCNYKKLKDGERIQIRIESNLTSISSKIETENESFGIIGYNSIIPYNLTQYVQVYGLKFTRKNNFWLEKLIEEKKNN
ncbi:Galectin domain-containing protein [Meloidogyne graminicola]|uniref:Galectin domain-containing protein n=1 Tax=Meloidogyne graminicola TaxID=189291 RepID=A0A8S9ZDH8_9BILA|nr:Galectin domain-containing protein [Meloidogyne graminicola]